MHAAWIVLVCLLSRVARRSNLVCHNVNSDLIGLWIARTEKQITSSTVAKYVLCTFYGFEEHYRQLSRHLSSLSHAEQ